MSFTPRAGVLARVARALLRLILGALFRLRLDGTPPASGPYVLIANHQGWADAFAMIALFPAEPRLHFFGDKQGVRSAWWKGKVIDALGGIVLVDRTIPVDRGAIAAAIAVLEAGAPLVVFPEGRVSHREADLGPFERGTAYLALRARAPVLPVWVRGTAELYLGREIVLRLGALREPLQTAPTKEATAAFTEAIHADVAALATPWTEPAGVRKRWRWLTDIL